MHRTFSIMVGAALAVTTAAPGFSPAVAASVAMPSSAAIRDAAPAGMLTNVRDGRNWNGGGKNWWKYNGRGYGNRGYYRGGNYGYRNYGYRHHDHDDNFGAGLALGVFGLAAGALIANQAYRYPAYGGYGYGAPVYGTYGGYGANGWADACAQKYRSFDYRTGTYLGYDGRRHTCVLP